MQYINPADVPMLGSDHVDEINRELSMEASLDTQRDANHPNHLFSVCGEREQFSDSYKGDSLVGTLVPNTNGMRWEDTTEAQSKIIEAMTGRVVIPDNFDVILAKCAGPRMQPDGTNAFNGTYAEYGFGGQSVLPLKQTINTQTNQIETSIVL